MNKKEFNKICEQVDNMTDEEKNELLACLISDEDKMAMKIVESILDLVGSDTELAEVYKKYIDEYYKLPIENRRAICKDSYKKFIKNGNFDINSISILIAHEADHVERKNEPVVESILDLVGSNTELVETFGVYIDEYYKLPIKNRRAICKDSYKKFIKNGNFDINSISMLIAHEADHKEVIVDPIVEAIRENNKLFDERPKINFKGMHYDI